MLDLEQLSNINLKTITEDEADRWCEKLLNYNPSHNESSMNLIRLFEFTRSILKLKHIQTDVLIEELQSFESKFEELNDDLSIYRSNNKVDILNASNKKIVKELENKLTDKEKELLLKSETCEQLEQNLSKKEQEISQLNLELSLIRKEWDEKSNSLSVVQSFQDSLENGAHQQLEDTKSKLNEKNVQIEQLLDKLYDADRINLDLAEQASKLRVDNAKLINDLKISKSKSEMLSDQLLELKQLNISLIKERESNEQQIQLIRQQITEQRSISGSNLGLDQSTSDKSAEFYNQLTHEVKRLNLLLEVKENEVNDLRMLVSKGTDDQTSLLDKQEEIERLQQELVVVSADITEMAKHNKQLNSDSLDNMMVQNVRRRNRKLKKQNAQLRTTLSNLEEEAHNKDEELERVRRRIVSLIDGDEQLKHLLEENTVLKRMIKLRDEKIQLFINQLNKHQLHGGFTTLVKEPTNQNVNSENGNSNKDKETISLMDQVIAISVERDVLQKQLDMLKGHLESVHRENQELQLGMKEILDGIRQSDTNSDLVIECPSLERVCLMMENRTIYDEKNHRTNDFNGDHISLTKFILIKSELDFVRGQNEQLRSELKQLRFDFLSVIDEYTSDILKNWIILSTEDSTLNKYSTLESASQTLNTWSDDEQTNDPSEQTNSINMPDKLTDSKQSCDIKSTGRSIAAASKIYHHSLVNKKRRIKVNKTKIVARRYNPIRNKTQLSKLVDVSTEPMRTVELTENCSQTSLVNFCSKQTQTSHFDCVELGLDTDQTNSMLPIRVKDVEVQVNSIAPSEMVENQNKSTQTMTIPSKSKQSESICSRCSKYHTMLASIRTLIEKERKQMRLQEQKLQEQIDSLEKTLKLVHEEYQLDIDAKDEQIYNLRNKLIKSTSSIVCDRDLKSSDEVYKKTQSDVNEDSYQHFFIDQLGRLVESKSMENSNLAPSNNKPILETIITCLQNCLKQKDATLEEYRRMIEEMRQQCSQQLASMFNASMDAGFTMFDMNEMKNAQNNQQNQQSKPIETIYRDLFINPCVQENEELIELLKKAFTEIKMVRSECQHQVESIQSKLDCKDHTIQGLETKLDETAKEKQLCEQQKSDFQIQAKILQEKVDSLNNKINELTKRSRIQSASERKKKVENTVFQESADLRVKVAEMSNTVRQLQLDKWNAQKLLAEERQLNRQRLLEKDQSAARLSEQNSKLQALVAKLDKKLNRCSQVGAQSTSINRAAVPKNNQATQTVRTLNRVRFEDQTLSDDLQNAQGSSTGHGNTSRPNYKSAAKETNQMTDCEDYKQKLIDELKRELEKCLKREKMATVVKEITTLAKELTPIKTSGVRSEHRVLAGGAHQITPEQVYEHLIDMQFERLVSDNAQLKVRLRMQEIALKQSDCTNAISATVSS